jgi:hypothetical protein
MLGTVAGDVIGSYKISPTMDPSGSVTGSKRVCRGGAWNYGLRIRDSAANDA